MKIILFASLVFFASCGIAKDMVVTPAIMKVKNGHITFIKTGEPVAVSDSLDGKAAFIISKVNSGPLRLTRF
jgi:hypothetical protein